MIGELKAPENLSIDFRPSPKQYEVWKSLMPECPECGGEIVQKYIGKDSFGHELYKPMCSKCGFENLPKRILSGGSAGGGKSWLGCNWIAYCCIKEPGSRMVIARESLKSLRESTLQTFFSVIRKWGLIDGTNFKMNNQTLEITFWNGSSVLLKELQDMPSDPDFQRLGSLEIDGAFVDEIGNLTTPKGIEILYSRIRGPHVWNLGRVGKLLCSCNPCTTWVRSRWVMQDSGEPAILAPGDKYIPFSVFDNPNSEFVNLYVNALKSMSSEADRQRLLYGRWDWVDSNDAAAYWKFDGEKHLFDNLKEQCYDPLKPLIISMDFNVAPYMSSLAIQFDYDKKIVYILEEILGLPKEKTNNTPSFAKKLSTKLLSIGHLGGIVITGDPAGLARSTQTEDGINNYTIIMNALKAPQLHAVKKLLVTQPPQIQRLEFVNGVFNGDFEWKIKIDMRCRRFVDDLIYQKKNSDGTKCKQKVLDPILKVKYEKYGHLSDCLDYALCYFLSDEYKKFRRRSTENLVLTSDSSDIYDQNQFDW